MERELVLQGGSRGGRGWKTAVNSHLTGPASDILMAVAEATFLPLSLSLSRSFSVTVFKKTLASRLLSYKTRQDVLYILPDKTVSVSETNEDVLNILVLKFKD